MAKKVARASAASALASSVFPLPARALQELGTAVLGLLSRNHDSHSKHPPSVLLNQVHVRREQLPCRLCYTC